MNTDVLVPIFGIVFVFGIPLLAIWTEYKKDKALIEKGLYQPSLPSARPGWVLLLVGAIVTGIGIAGLISAFVFDLDRLAGIPGLVCLCVGIGLIIVYAVARDKKDSAQG
ncbi:MAG: hypothetical protein ACNA7X_05215 [Dehalococcoidia bacterium]